MILIDTSVWIDFFADNPKKDSLFVRELLDHKQVISCKVIMAEILSGKIATNVRKAIRENFTALLFYDLDWNQDSTWEKVIELAVEMRSKQLPVCGIVDRVIVLTAIENQAVLWTYDKKLQNLAEHFGINFTV